ncbi:AMP-binding protein [Psychroserpens ponticola]|uniref:AMP-binding protein n=1 Tax=Psychroserpens ponticola TaxID=2932268 RepID=A0ABY7S1S9_9FLAO|nr:AMP-binding protein [Psychroserpens ponticola]WCO03338.1 AMP-binding protein [Psychroserpens ponticola]
MTPTFDKINLKFKLNGRPYNHSELKEVAYNLIKEGVAHEKAVGDFLLDWLDNNDYVLVKTSGTTGTQKEIKLDKSGMVNSAIMTGDYFGLKPGDKALHCLPSRYISGKMMLVRAMILGLELDMIAPTLYPAFDDQKQYDFGAMIPLQLKNSLKRLDNFKTIIIGGARVSKSLIEAVELLNPEIYETFGMTETISHIAVKKLNHTKSVTEVFKTLPDVSISKNKKNCLIIDAPKLNAKTIITNDVIDLISENQFELIGRYDNMINSGGVKLFPEHIEFKLHGLIKQRFFIASEEDIDLGQKVILIIEAEKSDFDNAIFSKLQKHEVPKAIYYIPKFLETETGKVQRKKMLEGVLSSFTH